MINNLILLKGGKLVMPTTGKISVVLFVNNLVFYQYFYWTFKSAGLSQQSIFYHLLDISYQRSPCVVSISIPSIHPMERFYWCTRTAS